MNHRPHFLLAILTMLAVPEFTLAAGQGTPEEAKAMAVKAATYLQSVGPEKAFPEFNDKDGAWRDRDLYVVVMDSKGVMAANGNLPGMIGKSMLDLKDVDGKAFNRDILAIKDAGWVEFKWLNPLTKAVEPKSMYYARTGDYLVGVGAYSSTK